MSKPNEVQKLGMVVIPRATMQELVEAGIAAETVGLQRIGAGGALISLEGMPPILRHLSEKILACDDPEGISGMTNAYANLTKSQASTLKVIGCLPGAQQEGSKRQRKSFAASAPPIDVSPKSE